jgi:5'-3' exonuclease
MPQTTDAGGQEIGAVRGVVNSMLMMLEKGTTHIGVATDHVIESFRNDLFPLYKTGEGIPKELFSQFPILEESLAALGVRVWAMVEFEADDALAAAAAKAAQDERVAKVIICTPDKDLGQCVVGSRVVQLDRRKNEYRDAQGVLAKFGVKPESIPDYLAVVGDTADGYPGLKGWGAKGAASVLSIYEHLENIPRDAQDWHPSIKSAAKLAATLFSCFDEAILYRRLATLRLDVPVFDAVDDLRWRGPRQDFDAVCQRLKLPDAARRARALAATASATP